MADYTGTDIYCDEIIPEKLKVDIVEETGEILAFHHTKPHWQVHIVVTPKQHVASLFELSDSLAAKLLEVVKEVASRIKSTYGACRIITNLGDYQNSKHLHIHICYGKVNK